MIKVKMPVWRNVLRRYLEGQGSDGGSTTGSQELQKPRLRCCAVDGPRRASGRVDVEERRQVERSEVMDALEGENKTL